MIKSPPSSIACRALRVRLWITWQIWPKSTLIARRSSAIWKTGLTFDPANTKRTFSSKIFCKETTFLTGAPPFAKVSSWPAISCALEDACSASAILLKRGWDRSKECLAMDNWPNIAVRRLLKSWASPPANNPSDSNLAPLRRSSSHFFLSVTSWAIPITRWTIPELSFIGNVRLWIHRTSSSFATIRYSMSRLFPSILLKKRFSTRSRSPGKTTVSQSKGLFTSFWGFPPQRRSYAGLT